MLVRSCAEMTDLPVAGRTVALEGLTQQRTIFSKILGEAVERGELAGEADVNGLAWHYLGILQAIMTLPQAGATAEEARRVVDLGLLAWPPVRPPKT